MTNEPESYLNIKIIWNKNVNVASPHTLYCWFEKILNEFSSKTCQSIGTRISWIISAGIWWQIWHTSHVYQAHTYIAQSVPGESRNNIRTPSHTHHTSALIHASQTQQHIPIHSIWFALKRTPAHPHTQAIISENNQRNDQRNRKRHCYQPLVPKYHPAECSDI